MNESLDEQNFDISMRVSRAQGGYIEEEVREGLERQVLDPFVEYQQHPQKSSKHRRPPLP